MTSRCGGVSDLYDLYWNHIRWYADDNYGGFGTDVKIAAGDSRNRDDRERQIEQDWWRLDVEGRPPLHLRPRQRGRCQAGAPVLLSRALRRTRKRSRLRVREQDYPDRGWSSMPRPPGHTISKFATTIAGRSDPTRSTSMRSHYKDDYGSLERRRSGQASRPGPRRPGTIGHQGDQDAFEFAVEAGQDLHDRRAGRVEQRRNARRSLRLRPRRLRKLDHRRLRQRRGRGCADRLHRLGGRDLHGQSSWTRTTTRPAATRSA